MKPRLTLPAFTHRFHGPLRFGRLWRGHELMLRIVQLALLVVLAWFGAGLVATAVATLARSLGRTVS